MRLIIFTLYIICSAWTAFSQDRDRVLLLSSYNSSFPTFFQQVNGVRSVLDSTDTLLDIEFLDSKRFIDSTYKAMYQKILCYKLSKLPKYDAIISADDNALHFILQYQEQLFKETPIVFFGVNNTDLALAQNGNSNITGIVESVSMKETIELMITCFPKNNEVYAIIDNTESGQADLLSYRKLQSDFPNITFKEIALYSMSFEQYINELHTISPQSPVLLISAYNDLLRKTISFDESLSLLKKHLKSPLFHLWYHGMGEGVFGGKLISQYKQAEIASQITHEILHGKKIATMSVLDKSPNVYVFDFAKLLEFDIIPTSLPSPRFIINQPTNFYNNNRGIILFTLFVFVFLLFFIIILLFNIYSRRKIAIELSVQNQVYEKLNNEYILQNEQLLQAKEKAEESDRLKTEFIHNMSHEVRTPLNGILGFSGFLSEPLLPEEQQKQYISIIQSSGYQLMRIIDDILEISILGTKQVEIIEQKLSLNNLLHELHAIFSINALENKTPLYIKNELSDVESVIICDEGRLNKIVSNLLENAIKFTKEGYIEFGSRLINSDGKLWIQIFVKDTGIGIRKENHRIIFERFSQEEKELTESVGGLGLGLSIAKESAEVLGGTVTVISEKGEGATFLVTLPYKPCHDPEIVAHAFSSTIENRGYQNPFTLLIAEDEPINRQFLESLIKEKMKLNCLILSAKTGEDAVSICHSGKAIDLVLLDLKMPIMDGFEAARLIKQLRPNLAIIAQTTYKAEQDREKAFTAGCDEFISKPIQAERLSEIIAKYLR